MNVLMISPGFPSEMALFTRGLGRVGARVIGLGDQPRSDLPTEAKAGLAAYVQIPSFQDEGAILAQVREIHARAPLQRVECLWEPYMVLAAKMREMLGLPGMTVAETIPFRDKEEMKRVLDAAGIRTPRHARATTAAQVREAAEWIGYPIIVKPIAGAGSSDTYRANDAGELEQVVAALGHVPVVSVEEFVEGEDYTFDTICIDGEIQHSNIAFYRPRALVSKENEWVSPQTVCVRDPWDPALAPGREMGEAVLKALGFQTGYTHMEWYRKPNGEAVFGEIGARSPGASVVDLINYASDIDTYTGWAEAVVHGRFTQPVERKYNAAWIFKRARGQGRIQRIEGLESILSEFGQHIVEVDLSPVGTPRRNWRQSLKGDGAIFLRHPDLTTTLEMADRVATQLQMYAG